MRMLLHFSLCLSTKNNLMLVLKKKTELEKISDCITLHREQKYCHFKKEQFLLINLFMQ